MAATSEVFLNKIPGRASWSSGDYSNHPIFVIKNRYIYFLSASPIIADLMERQTRTKVAEDEVGYIGISLQEVTSQISQMYNMPEGIYVVSVEEGSAAANAGIMKGDIITKFDGSSISSYSDLQKTLQYYAAGDSVTITVQRPQNGEYVSVELNLTLGSRPADKK